MTTTLPGATRVEIVNDRAAWNAFVESQATGNITQTYEWADLGHAAGGNALRLGAYVDDELRGAMLIVVEQAPLLRRPVLLRPARSRRR